MKKMLLSILTTLLVVAMTLAAVFMLVGATIRVAEMSNPLARALAVVAEIVLGIILLVGTTFLATHLAVLIFAPTAGNTAEKSPRA